MGGIALDGNLGTRLGKNRLFGIVGKYNHQQCLIVEFHLIREAAIADRNGINTYHSAIRTVYPKLALIDVAQAAFETELAALRAACHHHQCKQYVSKVSQCLLLEFKVLFSISLQRSILLDS